MGSYSREARCQRFIEEFTKDYEKKLTPTFNDAFVSSGLGIHDTFLVVMFWVRLKDVDGNEHEYTDGSIIYDPDEPNDDLVERICDALIDNEAIEKEFEDKRTQDQEYVSRRNEIRERMKKADLL